MKKFIKIAMVAGGFVLAVAASSTKSNAGTSNARTSVVDEGCRGTGECGTTPGGTKLNGSYTVTP